MSKWHYTITITPKDRTNAYSKLKFMNPQRCVYMDDKAVIEQTMRKNKIKSYIIYPELSETGRLHYHGSMYLSDSQRVSLFKAVKPKLESMLGFVDVQPVKPDMSLHWIIYCKKTWAFSQSLLDVTTPISPVLSMHNRGRKEGFKSQRDLLDLDTNPITSYFGI